MLYSRSLLVTSFMYHSIYILIPFFRFPLSLLITIPGGSGSKESACNAGDAGLIPALV